MKLLGATAGFTATGTPLEITDRIGGTVQVLGQPGHPVILTSLNDNTVGAGLDPSGQPQNDTDNNPNAVPQPGDWRSIMLDHLQQRPQRGGRQRGGAGLRRRPTDDQRNDTTKTAQELGQLATSVKAGDENLRLGFEVHGAICHDNPTDVDVYSFTGTAGTEVWIAIERTTFALDSVIELVDANGNVIARSDSQWAEGAASSLLASEQPDPNNLLAMPVVDNSAWSLADDYSTNAADPGMRVALPGTAGQSLPYYVRVYSAVRMAGLGKVTDLSTLYLQTFSITDANNKTVTFQFVKPGTNAAKGDVAVTLTTKAGLTTLQNLQNDIVTAVNGAGFGCTAVAFPTTMADPTCRTWPAPSPCTARTSC